MELRALTWNLFHGRDKPPDPSLLTWRSRLFRISERNETHLQVNRDLFDEFAGVLSGADWDIALLQECPPRWHDELALRCEADADGVLTSRNSLARFSHLVARLSPDLIASNEGGSNLTLVRRHGAAEGIAQRRELVLREGTPERRAMAFTRTGTGVCVANLHCSTADELAAEELQLAAQRACEWARQAPLIFGGDLNVRPQDHPELFYELRQRLGFTVPERPDSIDHLLARGLDEVEPEEAWPPSRREVRDPKTGLAIRLSDHSPVEASFRTP